MKQKKLNNILYVFDVNPYEITQDTDAEVIKVQEESYKGFVEMNQSLAEKIVKYNYHTMCVNVPEWAPYVEQEDPQGSLTFGIYGSAAAEAINQIQVQNADNVILESWNAGVDLEFPFQTDVEEGQHIAIECKEGTDIYQFNVTGAEYLPVRWEDQETGRIWYATNTITDSISIGINAPSPAEITVTAPYGLEIYDEATGNWVEYWESQYAPGFEEAHLVVGRTYSVEQRGGIGQGKVVVFNPECGTGSQGTVGTEFIAPETDLVITLADAPVSTHTVEITSDIAMAEIMEQTSDHQTIVNTYTSPSSPFTMTVNDGNIVTVEFDNGEPSYIYDISPNGFFAGQWQNPDTGKYISWSEPISDDVNVTIATPQPSTYTVTLDGSDIHQHVTVKMNGETVQTNIEYQDIADGTVVDVYPTGNEADYSLISGAVWDTDHWTATVNGADLTISINYLGTGVNFVASWDSGSTPENVDQINIGSTPVTGNALGDSSWTDTVRLYPGSSNITFFVSTGLPSDMDTFRLTLDGIEHKAHWDIDPQTGDKTVYDDNGGAANPGTWTYNDNPDTGLPYIAFELPALSDDDTPWQDNDTMLIYVQVQGS